MARSAAPPIVIRSLNCSCGCAATYRTAVIQSIFFMAVMLLHPPAISITVAWSPRSTSGYTLLDPPPSSFAPRLLLRLFIGQRNLELSVDLKSVHLPSPTLPVSWHLLMCLGAPRLANAAALKTLLFSFACKSVRTRTVFHAWRKNHTPHLGSPTGLRAPRPPAPLGAARVRQPVSRPCQALSAPPHGPGRLPPICI